MLLLYWVFIINSITFGNDRVQHNDYVESIPGSEETIPMTFIAGGTFLMGSAEKEKYRNQDEGPQKEVSVGDFWMSTYEISWDQYQLFLFRNIDESGSRNADDLIIDIDGVSGATMPYVNFNKPGFPVINVTQYAASTFCKWLTAKTGRFYRLPTEAEWEYACRGNTTTTYFYGDNKRELDRYGWFSRNSEGMVRKPGQKEPNPLGLYDIIGNVAEWCLDGYSNKAYNNYDTSTDPLLTAEDLYPRVVRGGSWKSDEPELRSAARDHSSPAWKKRDPQLPKSLWWHTDATHIGFRIVRPKLLPSSDELNDFWIKPKKEY